MKRKFKPFPEARSFVRKLELKGDKEWRQYLKSGKKPHDIPSDPAQFYKNRGWHSLGDWLGTEKIANSKRSFLGFEDARDFVHKLKIHGETDWKKYCKIGNKPDYIPSNPNRTFKNKGWINWGDWFGTNTIKNTDRLFLTFDKARKFVHSLKLKNEKQWREYYKSHKIENIPTNPHKVYRKEWISMGDWLGTGTIAARKRQFRSFNDAKKYIHSLGLKNQNDWRNYSKSNKKPDDIPTDPNQVYKNKGWISFGDWLGTGTIAPSTMRKNYLSFREARDGARILAKKFNLKTWDDWKKAKRDGKIPKNIPLRPYRVYAKNGNSR